MSNTHAHTRALLPSICWTDCPLLASENATTAEPRFRRQWQPIIPWEQEGRIRAGFSYSNVLLHGCGKECAGCARAGEADIQRQRGFLARELRPLTISATVALTMSCLYVDVLELIMLSLAVHRHQ